MLTVPFAAAGAFSLVHGHGSPGARDAGRRRAMTLSETLALAFVTAIVLLGIAIWLTTMRTELKRGRTEQLLVLLDEAVSAYHEATGAWPAGGPTAASSQPERSADSASSKGGKDAQAAPDSRSGPPLMGERDESATAVVSLLAGVPASRQVLDRVPAGLRSHVRVQTADSAPAWGAVHDGWGRPLRCLTSASVAPVDREAVAVHGGRPIFISAGEDGSFGTRDRAAAADNLRSDELPG